MRRLVLIDGSSYLYRAFHALPPLSNPEGEPTGALFGVVNMLRSTLKERPDYAAFVLDAPGKTFRDALDSEYKVNRPPMPDELRAQVQPMCGIVHALGVDILCIDGVEADDVIGTLALAAIADGIAVTISTSDKDFAQLVRPGVVLVNTMSGSRMDSESAVIDKFGVAPHQIVDLLALMGDAVDNVPGVDKCGPKTAAKWLAEYGSLDAVIANADSIKGKIGDNLRAALPRLPLNRALVTIKTDVALDKVPHDLVLRERDTDVLRGFYQRYGFTQALKELEGSRVEVTVAEQEPGRAWSTGFRVASDSSDAMDIDPALSAQGEYETILTVEHLQDWIVRLRVAGQFAFDTETDSLDPMQAVLVGVSFAAEMGRAAYLPLGHDYPSAPVQLDGVQALALLQPLLEDAAVRKLGQHGKYDMHVLRRYGITLAGYADDTLLESFVLSSGHARHDMDTLAKRHLGYETMKYVDVAGKGAKQIPFSHVGVEEATRYAAEDADITLRLHRILAPQLSAEPSLERIYREIEMPLVPVLERVEANGVQIDAQELYKQSADLSRRMMVAQQK
ncbi:MAG TPA: 5'-3' exonuclease H3TH domain-containing protein, partial [Xylella sp.]